MTCVRWPRHSHPRASPRGLGVGHGAVISLCSRRTRSAPIVQEPDPPTEDLPRTGRHRATPPPLRELALRVAVCAGALLVVAVLAVLTATWTGLTGTLPHLEAQAPTVSTDPTSGRTLPFDPSRVGRAAPTTDAPQPVAESSAPVPAGSAAPEPPSAPAPEPTAEPSSVPAPLPDVRPGAPCPVEGAHGMTAAGKPAACTVRGDGAPRWRRA
jgi:hypothetical protein